MRRGEAPVTLGQVVPASFFERASNEVAADLIGKILWREGFGGGRLSEVEAYLAADDPASHAAKGLTQRNAAMFGSAGTLYVFMSYGVHWLLNFVCERAGVASAVLVRSYEPLTAQDESHSGGGAKGPGVVGRALGVGLDLNGAALGPASGVYVLDDGHRASVGQTVRVGISQGQELPLRYYLLGSGYVSGPMSTRERCLG
jgi:DNA-3-methyladenine glycosylase